MLFNWEPLELPANMSYKVVSLGPANNLTGKVLDSLDRVAMVREKQKFFKVRENL